MEVRAADAARYAIRSLLPDLTGGLHAGMAHLGGGDDLLPHLAQHGATEVLAIRGLEPDESRVLQREVERLGGRVLLDREGARAVVLGPLQAIGALPQCLQEWGRRTEALGAAIGAVLTTRSRMVRTLRAGRFKLHTGRRTLVMGILNVTPDSFSGDGVAATQEAVTRGLALAEAGADIVDVGGESSRPHSQEVDEATELARVLPVVGELADRLSVPVCIDTRKAAVAAAAVAAGATAVNDIWGLRGDPAMAAFCAAHPELMLVVMHNRRGTAGGHDVVEDVCVGLWRSLEAAWTAGIDLDRVVVDPGFGFGKTPAQNLELVRRLGELRGLGRPLLLGASRKSTIGFLTATESGTPTPDQRLEGSLAMAVMGAQAGADMVRVHDVAETVRALRVADALIYGTPPDLTRAPAPGPTG